MQYPRNYVTAICLLVVVMTSGCTLGKNKEDRWRFAKIFDFGRGTGTKEDEPVPIQTPTRLVSTWTDTILYRQGEKAKRGFGGRLLFFNEQSDDPVRVDGQLVVYAYDESGRAAHETQPTRRFVFPREQFVRHESDSKLGPSYSFWLPWDEVGGDQKHIDLIARFEPNQGSLIVGEQTSHLLPGKTQLASSGDGKPTAQIDEIRLVQYSEESKLKPVATNQPNRQPRTTSIALKRSWQQRLQAGNGKVEKGPTESAAAADPDRLQ